MTKDSSTVRVTVGGGKARAWLFGILLGIIAGIGIAVSFLRFEPSAEYLEAQAVLDSTLVVLADSLDEVHAAKAETDSAVAVLLEERELVTANLRSARANANAHRRRADSLHAANEGTDDPTALHAEIAALSAALDARDAECDLCGAAVTQRDSIISGLQTRTAADDREIGILNREIDAFRIANDAAQAEIASAFGKLPKWWHPTITGGFGCTITGFHCGPAVTVGFSFSPF